MNGTQTQGIVFPLPARYRTNDFDLANVTPDEVRSILRGVRTGKLEDQDRLFRLMLDSWSRLRKCLNEVSGAVRKTPMTIHPAKRDDADPTPRATEIATTVRRAIESCAPRPGYWELDTGGMIEALVDAYAKGISVLEIVWHMQNGIVSPRCYAPIPARYLAFPTSGNEVDRLMLAPQGIRNSQLEDFPPDRFLVAIWAQGGVHPVHAANIRSLTKHWLGAIYGLGWLMQYAQLFGIPFRHAKTDGTADAMTKARQMLAEIGSAGWAVTSPGVEIDMQAAPSGSSDGLPQSQLMREADAACDILMLGQTLTTDVGSSGSRALGEVHQSVRADVLASVADWAANIITNQLIPAIVRMNYGSDIAPEDMPYCVIAMPQAKDTTAAAARIKTMVETGVPLPKKWMYEELGVPMPEPDEETFGLNDTMPQLAPVTAARAEIDLTPTQAMADNARMALDERAKRPPSERGMTPVGIARARDIANRVNLSPETIKRMVSFFARHEVDKGGSTWDERGKGWQAWQGWGGDEGRAWAESKLEQLAQ